MINYLQNIIVNRYSNGIHINFDIDYKSESIGFDWFLKIITYIVSLIIYWISNIQFNMRSWSDTIILSFLVYASFYKN